MRKLKIEAEIEIEEFIEPRKLQEILKVVIAKVFFTDITVNSVIVREIDDGKETERSKT